MGRAVAIIIDVAEDNQPIQPIAEKFTSDFNLGQYSPEQICEAARQAGIVGMGGAGFPTAVKLRANPESPIDTVIINACECEPFLTCDYRMMIEWTDQILAGSALAGKSLSCENIIIAIEDNKPDAIAAFKEAVRKNSAMSHIQILAVETKYPQGGERQLIKSVTGRDVPVGGIPPMVKVLVTNVGTAAAIAEAVCFANPLTHRVVTVTGGGINRCGNFYVPIGTPVEELIDFCGGLGEKAVKVLLGGPMMGFAIGDLSIPITKTCGAITVLTEKEIGKAKNKGKQTPCIRCGRCLDVCPIKLNPTKIAHAVKYDMLETAADYHMAACMECGCCSYVCPGNIEVAGHIKTGKILVARQKKKMPQ